MSSAAIERAHADAVAREYELERDDARERARSGLLNFTCYTKPDFEVTWHNRLLCRELNRFCDGDTENLLVMQPPRTGKSELVSRRMPAYVFGRHPDTEFIAASYGFGLAKRMNRDVQRVMSEVLYAELFPSSTLNAKNRVTLADGSWLRNSEMFEIVGHRGYYLCAGVGGSLTGAGCDIAVCDDPLRDWKAAYSEVQREGIWEWFTSVLLTRLSKRGRVCVTQTRWHEADLAGRLLSWITNDPDMARRWRVVVLRAIKEGSPDEHPDDPREPGEALWPQRFPLDRLERMKRLNPSVFVSLYQQRPSPPEGNIIKGSWWKIYRVMPSMEWFDKVFTSIDLPFKKRKGKDPKKASRQTDFACFQVWGKKGTDVYLLHQVRDRMSWVEQKAAFRQLVYTWPTAEEPAPWAAHVIEAAANGEALISEFEREVAGLIRIYPKDDKVSRAEAIAGWVQAGNVWLPHESIAPWVPDFLLEWAVFPAGANDDQCDATTMSCVWALGGNMAWQYAMPEAIDTESVWHQDGQRLVSMPNG